MTAKKHIHEKRGITFAEYAALLGVRELLVRGDVKVVVPWRQHEVMVNGGHVFTMSHPGSIYHCGTIGCIGGYVGFVMGNTTMPNVSNGDPFYSLFYPTTDYYHANVSWKWITPKVAVKAIDNWIKTGDPGWNKLVPVKLRKTRKAR